MKWIAAVLGIVLVALSTADAWAAAKVSSTGVACNTTGTARKDGKDQDGNKMNCQWDTCTYCGTTTGKIDCSKQITEYSNPTDCHPVASISHGNGLSKFNGNLNLQQQFKQQPGAPQSPKSAQ